MSATPRPWECNLNNPDIDKYGSKSWDIVGCEINKPMLGQNWNKLATVFCDEANAALIVRAVNSHDALVSILKDVSTWLETNLELGLINAGTANRDSDLVSQIRQALALAEGKE